jgi:phosphoribosylaminoimidazolecarboxamide formyltransferase/IMP cyclohydrolase
MEPQTQQEKPVKIRRALLSVSDKTGIVAFAKTLSDEFGVELLSTGGTSRVLREAGLPVTDVADVTGFPEMMNGRVKTLHPKIHGALLGRLPTDEAAMQEHDIRPIDLVCVNLYPFEETVARPDVAYAEAIENIDIGGPSMIRSAAKNHERVLVVSDPAEYGEMLEELRMNGGASSFKQRQRSAEFAFLHTSDYDGAITNYLWKQTNVPVRRTSAEAFEWQLNHAPHKLRYGENPHQRAFHTRHMDRGEASVAHAKQVHGKELGYINLLDADAALGVVKEWQSDQVAACCIVKHATPCGVGIKEKADGSEDVAKQSSSVRDAFLQAYGGDPLAAFGGVVAVNQTIDETTARAMTEGQMFLEVVVAPSFEATALKLLKERWKNVRLLEVGLMLESNGDREHLMRHAIVGGWLVQERDLTGVVEHEWKVVSDRQPTDAEMAAMKFNWLACKHVKSNAVVIGGEHGTYGIGGGQVDRVAAAQQAVKKAGDRGSGAVAASDAFFPFPDGPQALLNAGVTAIVQPGGSRNDQLTIDLVNNRGATMIFTGRRHFRH